MLQSSAKAIAPHRSLGRLTGAYRVAVLATAPVKHRHRGLIMCDIILNNRR